MTPLLIRDQYRDCPKLECFTRELNDSKDHSSSCVFIIQRVSPGFWERRPHKSQHNTPPKESSRRRRNTKVWKFTSLLESEAKRVNGVVVGQWL